MTAFTQLRSKLTLREVRSLKAFAFAVDKFEPYPAYLIGKPTIDNLIDAGAVEAGPSDRPAVGQTGYRLTKDGWEVALANWPYSIPL